MKHNFIGAVFVALGMAPTSLAGEATQANKDAFQLRCIACHAVTCNKIGPRLGDLIGRTAGTVKDFSGYSDELKNSGIVWSEENMNTFLQDPNEFVPGTLMVSAGKIESQEERNNIVAFLKSGDDSLDLCF